MAELGSALARARKRGLAVAFGLLYNQAARLYDPVSWLVSLGMWRSWQRTALPFLPESGRILDAGCGPGHLLVDLVDQGYEPVGLDLSRGMLRLARRRLARRKHVVPLCQGAAETLPFPSECFAAVLSSFPTSYVFDDGWLRQVRRVLQRGGFLVVVEQVSFPAVSPVAGFLRWLYRVTGQQGPAPDLPHLLAMAGLEARRETVEIGRSSVHLVVAVKRLD
jgi:ubiquinone/menaquinone biosynthesis C-methylase UbiE